MEIAVLLVLAELWLVLLWPLGVPTLLKGRVGLFVLGIFVPSAGRSAGWVRAATDRESMGAGADLPTARSDHSAGAAARASPHRVNPRSERPP